MNLHLRRLLPRWLILSFYPTARKHHSPQPIFLDYPTMLPANILPTHLSQTDRRLLQRAGFVLGQPLPTAPLLTSVRFPPGWLLHGNPQNPVWYYLYAPNGYLRATICYDPREHSRQACFYFLTRYEIQTTEGQNMITIAVTDNTDQSIVFNYSLPFTINTATIDQAKQMARKWLNEHFPLWEDITAYWEETLPQTQPAPVFSLLQRFLSIF